MTERITGCAGQREHSWTIRLLSCAWASMRSSECCCQLRVVAVGHPSCGQAVSIVLHEWGSSGGWNSHPRTYPGAALDPMLNLLAGADLEPNDAFRLQGLVLRLGIQGLLRVRQAFARLRLLPVCLSATVRACCQSIPMAWRVCPAARIVTRTWQWFGLSRCRGGAVLCCSVAQSITSDDSGSVHELPGATPGGGEMPDARADRSARFGPLWGQ